MFRWYFKNEEMNGENNNQYYDDNDNVIKMSICNRKLL